MTYFGAGVMAQGVKLTLSALASQTGEPGQVLTAPFPSLFTTNTPGKAADGPKIWALIVMWET